MNDFTLTIDLGAGHRLLGWRSGDRLRVQVYRQAGARGIEDLGAVLASRVFPVDWPIDKVLRDAADAVAALGVQPPGWGAYQVHSVTRLEVGA